MGLSRLFSLLSSFNRLGDLPLAERVLFDAAQFQSADSFPSRCTLVEESTNASESNKRRPRVVPGLRMLTDLMRPWLASR
jgi:hypothetical protein